MTETLRTNLSYPEKTRHIKKYTTKLRKALPELMESFYSLSKYSSIPGTLDVKTKELIALAIGVATKCDGCVAFHTQAVLRAGASPEEIMETLGVTVAMGGGPSLMYASRVLEAMEQFQNSQ
jgi:AhpD family alkylhydroperoxidase